MKIKLTSQQAKFLREFSHRVVTESGDKWSYFPYWWHETDEPNVFDSVDIDNLPEEVKDVIKSFREGK
jgi:hypothetical protein